MFQASLLDPSTLFTLEYDDSNRDEFVADAKKLGYRLPRHPLPPPREICYGPGEDWVPYPRFTVPAYSRDEKELLGRTVHFKRYDASLVSPLSGVTCLPSYHEPSVPVVGTVWSLGPQPRSVWVYVAEERVFHLVKIDRLRRSQLA